MDHEHDQEVVREPFEQEDFQHSERETSSSGDSESITCFTLGGTKRTSNDLDHLQESQPFDQVQSTESDDGLQIDDHDVNFAKSFGICLKRSKIELANERIIHSEHFKKTNSEKNQLNTIETSTTSDCIYHKGTFYQKGDIVALCDQEDGEIYFAQLTGFLQDQFCEKSASIYWLVPKQPTSRDFFDPAAYKIGLEDTQLRKLDCMTFIRHCPHDYYLRDLFHEKGKASEKYPAADDNDTIADASCQARSERSRDEPKNNRGSNSFIWTSMKPCSVPTIEIRGNVNNKNGNHEAT